MTDRGFQSWHEQLRDTVGRYLEEKVSGKHKTWVRADDSDTNELRKIYEEMGSYGWITPWASEGHGGCEADFLTSYVICDEIGKRGLTSLYVGLASEIAGMLIAFGDKHLQDRYMPSLVSGQTVISLAMGETGSFWDLCDLQTTAVVDGDSLVVNGPKSFVPFGMVSDHIIVACKTNAEASGFDGVSLLLMEADAPGLSRTTVKRSCGNALNAAAIEFHDVRVPLPNVIGGVDRGALVLKSCAPRINLLAAVQLQGLSERSLSLLVDYAVSRTVFGSVVSAFQNTEFAAADMYSKCIAGRSLVDSLAISLDDNLFTPPAERDCFSAQLFALRLAQDCINRSIQVHGGYGICTEYEIAQIFGTSFSAIDAIAGLPQYATPDRYYKLFETN